jgi:hypothetical protein
MLVIRPWDGRHLKSKSSTRVLPLALLPEDELLDVLKWTYKRREELDGVGNEQFLFGLPKLAQDQVTVEVFALVQRAMREVTGDHTLHYHHLRHSAASWAFLRLCVSDFREVIDLFPEPKTTDLLRDSERFRSIIYSAFPINKGEARYELSEEDRYATDGPIRQHSFAIALLLGHADPSTTLEHYIHFLDIVLPMYRRNREFFPVSRLLGVIPATGFSEATGYRYDMEDLPAEVWRHPDCDKQIAPDLPSKGLIFLPHGGDVVWIDQLRRMLLSADKEHLSNDELAARHEIEPSMIAVLLHRARELKAMKLHTMESWVPDLRYPQDKLELGCPFRPTKASDRGTIERLEHAFVEALADSGFRDNAERVLNYYVTNQKDNGPLLFEDPAQPEDAQAYLTFLEGLGIQRLNVENKLAPGDISRPSEVRLVCHDPQSRLRWREALPFKSRDVLWPKRARQAESDLTQCLGILSHLNTAPEKPLVGNLGFRYFMLMAWIAWPWLVKPWLVNRNGNRDA